MNKSMLLSFILVALATQIPAEAYSAENASASPTSFESVPEGEAGQIAEIIFLTTQLLKDRYSLLEPPPERLSSGMARRAVHPKDHGCVKASFTINQDIPEKYRVGVLTTPGTTYQAWVRFSNATGRITPDAPGGAATSRGMAIKLMGVRGTTLLGEPGAKTQDFLLINQPMFAFANVAQYLEVTRLQLQYHDENSKVFGDLFKLPLPENKETIKIVQQVSTTQLGNLLDTPYFSASPFTFGKDRAAKFAVKPRVHALTPMPASPIPDNYLREALKKSLDESSGKPVVFDFRVQLRTSDAQSIENASVQWDETSAPFQNVAVLTIDPQNFDTPLRVTECEHLVFTPWHGLVEFQPIGGINRLRLGVYAASSQYRAQPKEPGGFPKENP